MKLITLHKILILAAGTFFVFFGVSELLRTGEQNNKIVAVICLILAGGCFYYYFWVRRGGYEK